MKPLDCIDFLVIGAGKAGTTSLYYYLAQHPQLYLPKLKEPRFLRLPNLGLSEDAIDHARQLRKQHPGAVTSLSAYQRLFHAAGSGQKRGECSVQYLTDPEAAGNISRYGQHLRLICVLRDPVMRAFSNFLHFRRDGLERACSLGQVLSAHGENHDYFAGGFYARHLGRYRQFLDNGQLRVWLFEDFQEQPLKVLEQMFRHLGVATDVQVDTSLKANVSGRAATGDWLAAGYDHLRSSRLKPLLNAVLPFALRRTLIAWLGRHSDAGRVRDVLDPDQERLIAGLYQEDLDELEKMLERDLSAWRKT